MKGLFPTIRFEFQLSGELAEGVKDELADFVGNVATELGDGDFVMGLATSRVWFQFETDMIIALKHARNVGAWLVHRQPAALLEVQVIVVTEDEENGA